MSLLKPTRMVHLQLSLPHRPTWPWGVALGVARGVAWGVALEPALRTTLSSAGDSPAPATAGKGHPVS